MTWQPMMQEACTIISDLRETVNLFADKFAVGRDNAPICKRMSTFLYNCETAYGSEAQKKSVSEVVSEWPEWKRNILGVPLPQSPSTAANATNQEPVEGE